MVPEASHVRTRLLILDLDSHCRRLLSKSLTSDPYSPLESFPQEYLACMSNSQRYHGPGRPPGPSGPPAATPTRALVNAFELRWSEQSMVYHYDGQSFLVVLIVKDAEINTIALSQ